MTIVEYNRDTYNQCLCGGCPVNRSSQCTAERSKAVNVSAIENEGKMPDPEILGGIYCSTGKSHCDDLNDHKSCLCPACPVEIETNLSTNYFCVKGKAEEVVMAP